MSRNLINATKYFIISLCILTFGLAPTIAGAKETPEEKCEIKKHKAAKKRAGCLAKQATREIKGQPFDLAQCEVKFDEDIAKADAKAAEKGAECRYVDRGLTVFDLNTLLEWQKATDDGVPDPVTDKDITYTFAAAYSSHVSKLNCSTNSPSTTSPPAGLSGGHAGHCDWRVPVLTELQSIRSTVPPDCDPCIDPLFGPTAGGGNGYWSNTALGVTFGDGWVVYFREPSPAFGINNGARNLGKATLAHVRGVRGGGRP